MIKQPFQGARKAASLSPGRVYFRKAGHVCRMNNKGPISVNLGQFEGEALLQQHAVLKFFGVWVSHAISMQNCSDNLVKEI